MSEDELMGLTVYVGSLCGLGFLILFLSWVKAASAKSSIKQLKAQIYGQEACDVVPVFEENKLSSRITSRTAKYAVIANNKMAVVDQLKNTIDLTEAHEVTTVTMLQDDTGSVGLQLESKAHTVLVSGLDALLRSYKQLSSAPLKLNFNIASSEARLATKINRLHSKEAELIREWLVEDESILEIVPDIRFKGKIPIKGRVLKSRMIVTNLRLSLIVQSQTVQHVGNAQRATIHFGLVNYSLPLAERLTLTPASSLRSQSYLSSMTYKEIDGQKMAEPPQLILAQEHGAVLFPIAVCQSQLEVQSRAPGYGRLIAELLIGSLLFGIVGGIFIGGPYAGYWGIGGNSWMEPWVPVVIVAGAIAGAVIRGISTVENYIQRGAQAALSS
jgi:hypothetical protein